MSERRKEALASALKEVRERTLWLFQQAPDEFLQRRVHGFYSPIGWHFGHVGRTEEYWVCQALGTPPHDEALSFLYADLPDNPKDNRVHIPDRAGTLAYLAKTREFALSALASADLDSDERLVRDGYAWDFAVQHECQHQETIAEMLCLIHQSIGEGAFTPMRWERGIASRWVTIAGGDFSMGSNDPFGYDNERSEHLKQVGPFAVSSLPVTAYDWSEFMSDGGYDRPELWTDSGWQWRVSEGATKPEYWVVQDGQYGVFSALGLRALHPDEPAASISWFEADAYARWKGGRLLSEPEWEFVAGGGSGTRYAWGDEAPDSESARFGLAGLGPCPVGLHDPTQDGLYDLAGNAWEWTSSPFLPYPGFEAYPYDGYSKEHMKGGHLVCRGGSWATAAPILRCTFRNWYVPSYRQGFLGMRLARSL